MIQPIQNAMHLHKTDKVFLDIGAKLLELRDITRSFREDLAAAGAGGSTPVKLSFALERLPTQDVRRAFMTVVDQPERLEIVLKDLSRLEIYWRIAQKEGLNVVLFQPHVLAFENAVDISLKSETAVPVSLALSKDHRPHTVLTGPNGGGKSSFMRATLQMVLLGHAYGFAHVKFAIMPRFSWIASGLQLRDTPGVYSMFETEVKFAADCLKKIGQPSFGPGLILYDELFHSTNPPDGTRTAQVFLQSLWSAAAGSVYSVVSTHVFPLVEGAPAAVLPICCPAEETPEGDVKFSYTIEPGICRVSSVKKVWERFGLSQLTAKKAGAAAKSAEPKPLRQKELDAAKDAE
jgi:DNA mismatch repair ATPase MutS